MNTVVLPRCQCVECRRAAEAAALGQGVRARMDAHDAERQFSRIVSPVAAQAQPAPSLSWQTEAMGLADAYANALVSGGCADTRRADLERHIAAAGVKVMPDPRDLWFAEWELVLPKDAREAWPAGVKVLGEGQ
jgi:hypothetical protein